MANLGKYQDVIAKLAEQSPMATDVPSTLPELHTTFARKYQIIRRGRNAAVHEGSFARHLAATAVELALVLEEGIMHGLYQVGDFMVRNPVCAYMWQPISFIRQTMLTNSFSYLPVATGDEEQPVWQVISDYRLARYLRVKGEVSKDLLIQRLSEAVDSKGLKLHPVQICGPEDRLDAVWQETDALPMLVLSPGGRQLLGILTPFDLL
jgi:CBS domain-containing protein